MQIEFGISSLLHLPLPLTSHLKRHSIPLIQKTKEKTAMAMSSSSSSSSSGDPPPFPFLLLPIHLQEAILSLLPISALLPLLTVSRSFLSLLRSPTFPSPPPDLFFLLFAPASPPLSSLLSFHPSSRRWLSLPIPPSSPLSLSLPFATSSFLAISSASTAGHGDCLVAVRMFARNTPPKEIPPMIHIGDPYVLAVIPDVAASHSSDHFKIVAASSSHRGVFSQVYDSRHGNWVPAGEIPSPFVILGDTALIGRSLYVHAYLPDQLLRFDLVSHTWRFVIPMPENMMSSHLFAYDQNLYLIAGFEVVGVISAIRVLKLDWGENCEALEWREILVLSKTDEVFLDFTNSSCWLYYFKAVDRAGMVCLHNSLNNKLLLFDVRDMSWVSLPPCCSAPKDVKWYGHATEMGLEVLRPGIA